jgi:uncharacterized protein with PIN domain
MSRFKEFYRCPDCGQRSPSSEWEYDERDQTGDDDYDWWWTCPRCGAKTPNYPEDR